MNTKKCSDCKKNYSIEYFFKDRTKKDGLHNLCKDCAKAAQKKYREHTKEKRAKQAKIYYLKNKIKIDNYNKDFMLKKRYGFSLEQWNELYEQQKGRCGVCGETQDKKKLAVDHNHETNQIRKLLCPLCNFMVGYIENHRDKVQPAINYLDSFAIDK